MRFAYADPPYPSMARFYKDDPRAAEVNLPMLIAYLEQFDAWALSTASTTLRQVLPLTPPDTRVMAWVKPFASFKPNVPVAYAWEPVLVRGARGRGCHPTIRDWCAVNMTLRRGLVGAKPREFCMWLFDVVGAAPTDEFVDVFPGSGAVTAAWHEFCGLPNPQPLPLEVATCPPA